MVESSAVPEGAEPSGSTPPEPFSGAPADTPVSAVPAEPLAEPPAPAAPAEVPAEVPAPAPAQAQTTPEVAPAPPSPAPVPAPAEPAPDPAIADSLIVPPSEAPPGEGGEWELLVARIRDWLADGRLQEQVARYRSPLQVLGLLLAVLVVLRIYTALLGAIDSLPLVSGLLELAGVIWLARFSLTRLVRSSDRRELVASLRSRWQSFRGNG